MATERLKPRIITDPKIVPVDLERFGDRLSRIYYYSWGKEALCTSFAEARKKVFSFDPEHAFMLLDTATDLPYAVIHTLPIQAPTVVELIRQFPIYAAVEQASAMRMKFTAPNARICFSITALPGFRVIQNGREQSLARTTILGIPQDYIQIPYSRISNLPPGISLFDFVTQFGSDPKMLGPVGMHMTLGARIVAVLPYSRPEGGGNVLLRYPYKNEVLPDTLSGPVIRTDQGYVFRRGNVL